MPSSSSEDAMSAGTMSGSSVVLFIFVRCLVGHELEAVPVPFSLDRLDVTATGSRVLDSDYARFILVEREHHVRSHAETSASHHRGVVESASRLAQLLLASLVGHDDGNPLPHGEALEVP